MKRHNVNIVMFLLGLFMLNSCIDEEVINPEGTDGFTTINLALKNTNAETITTRADNNTLQGVKDLYVFTFKENGECDASGFFTENGELPNLSTLNLTVDGSLSAITLEVPKGNHYIYAVANVIDTNTDDVLTQLTQVSSLTDLQSITTRLKENRIEVVGSYVLMSGFCASTIEDAKSGTAPLVNISNTNKSFTIYLKRIFTALNFEISCSNTDATFQLRTYRVVNAPSITTVLEKNKMDKDFPTETGPVVFKTDELTNFTTTNNNGKNKYSFSFYMLENTNDPTSSVTDIKDREKRDPAGGDPLVEASFTNAPTNSSYLILKGHYKGPAYVDKNDKGEITVPTKATTKPNENVDAEVTYYFHLGNLNNGLNDYSSLRNKNYTYILDVKSVDQIIAEVQTKDDYPRADGTVSIQGQIKLVDAHYETVIIKLKTSQEYEFIYDETKYENKPWITLVSLQRGYNEKQDGVGITFKDTPDRMNQYSYTSIYQNCNGSNYSQTQRNGFIKNTMDLNAELAILKKEGINYAAFLCFVDENYPKDDVKWRDYVNQPNREFQIRPVASTPIINGSMLLIDGVMISQYSMRTFYNISSGKGTAYGAEWVNESGAIKYQSGKNVYTKDEYQGWKNSYEEIGNTTGISQSFDEWEGIYTYNDASIACMQRNRDENGNGRIDENEIKWYLPSLKQYAGLWMGANILGEARIYKNNTTELSGMNNDVMSQKYHFWTSSRNGGSKYYLWGEEGFSYGQDGGGSLMQIRCVRNLGNQKNADLFYTHNEGEYSFDLSKLEKDALRERIEKQELSKHSENEDGNKLSKGFYYAETNIGQDEYKYRENYGKDFKWIDVNEDIDKGNRGPCAKDINSTWRLPNQRELALMNAENLLEGKSYSKWDWRQKKYAVCYMCRTYFSNSSYRYGYGQGYNGAPYMRLFTKNVLNHNQLEADGYPDFKIRCVKDK